MRCAQPGDGCLVAALHEAVARSGSSTQVRLVRSSSGHKPWRPQPVALRAYSHAPVNSGWWTSRRGRRGHVVRAAGRWVVVVGQLPRTQVSEAICLHLPRRDTAPSARPRSRSCSPGRPSAMSGTGSPRATCPWFVMHSTRSGAQGAPGDRASSVAQDADGRPPTDDGSGSADPPRRGRRPQRHPV